MAVADLIIGSFNAVATSGERKILDRLRAGA